MFVEIQAARDALITMFFLMETAQSGYIANSLKFRLMVHSYEAFKKDGTDLSNQMEAIASGNNYMNSVADNASIFHAKERLMVSSELLREQGNKYTRPKPTKYLIDQMKNLTTQECMSFLLLFLLRYQARLSKQPNR